MAAAHNTLRSGKRLTGRSSPEKRKKKTKTRQTRRKLSGKRRREEAEESFGCNTLDINIA